ncbi:hypothetical protein [Helicobacter typhlonius]|uniref:hypothetical protein n=1 Tax=Helicobacter typhlonius TaxID=76936 RepID=UPI002FDF0CB5
MREGSDNKIFFCLTLSFVWAEYSCDELKCTDYKVGLGALAGIHNTSLHDISILGGTLFLARIWLWIQ